MRVARIELAPFALPMAAVHTAAGTHAERAGFAIRITDDAGRGGLGEATPLPSQGTESLDTCGAALKARGGGLRGVEVGDPRDLDVLLRDLPPAARCGLELALLDLLGRGRRLPVAALLAEHPARSVEVSALLVGRETGALAAEARARADEGFGTLKLKVGISPLEEEVARVRAIRAAAGPGIELRLDANGAWSRGEARRALEALSAAARIELIEQPVSALEDLAALIPDAPLPLGADELLARPADADALIARRAAHAVVLKPMVLGGLIPARDLALRAHRAGLDLVVTTCLDGALARAGALHLAAALPVPAACGLATGFLFERDLGDEPVRVQRGRAPLSDAPGLGVELRAELDWISP